MKALGVNPGFVDAQSGFHAGTLGVTDDFRVFMYQEAGEAIGQHDACELRMEDGQAFQLSASRVSGTTGNVVGVAFQDLAANQFGWFQVYGPAQCNSSTVSRGAHIAPSGIAGRLGTDTGTRPIDGLLVTGGAGSLATVALSYPKIAAQVSSGSGASNVPDKPTTPASTTDYNLRITDTGGASWVEDTGGGATISPADAAPPQPNDTMGAAGTGTEYAREDHKHPLPAVASGTEAGLMSAASFSKLAGIANQATANDTPNAPARSLSAVEYNLEVESDGTIQWVEDTGGGAMGATGGEAFRLTPVGDAIALTANAQTDTTTGAAEGPDIDSLSDVIFLSYSYDRAPEDTHTHFFNSLFLKSDIGVDSDTPGWIQWQGSGEADQALYANDGKLTFGPYKFRF